jgi:hypothetical protein
MWFTLLLLQPSVSLLEKLEGEAATFLRCDAQVDGMYLCVFVWRLLQCNHFGISSWFYIGGQKVSWQKL